RKEDNIKALYNAICNNQNDIAMNIIKNNDDYSLEPINDIYDNTIMSIAIKRKQNDIISKLIEKCNDINGIITSYNDTTLLLACACRMDDIALKLIEMGADIDHTDDLGNNAVMLACRYKSMTNVALKLIEK